MSKARNVYRQANRTHLATVLASITAIAGVGLQNPANAQERLEEIIVTAQKREQSLQDTPISLTAIGSSALEAMRFTDISDLSGNVPNMMIRQSAGDASGATISMRGTVTTNTNINFEPTVGVYLDGVFISKNTGALLDVVDLERIEVLRGPQGTLYGKNTIGGAINLVTRKPEDEFGIRAKVGVGNYEERLGMVTVNLPAIGTIGEGLGKLSSKVTYRVYQRDGWVENDFVPGRFALPVSSDTLGEKDDTAARVSLLWDANDTWSVSYDYDMSEMNRTPPYLQLTNITPNGLFDPDGALCSPVPTRNCYAYTGLDQYASKDRIKHGSNDHSFTADTRVEGHAATIQGDELDWGSLGDVTLRSITAYRSTNEHSLLDLDGSNIDIASFLRDVGYDVWSQEFQLIGKTDTLDYVLGVYYLEEEAEVNNPGTFFGFFRVFGATINPVITQYGFDNSAAAVYGQVDWRPADEAFDNRLKITVGGRFTGEEKDFHKLRVESNGRVSVPYTDVQDSYQDFSPMLAISWDISEESTVYAKIAEGFKSGAFNHAATTVDTFRDGFDPESLISYELGLKSRWLDQRLQLNGAIFYSDYEDIQISNFKADPNAGNVSVIDNAGKANISGAELELVALLTEGLTLNASYGYLDGDYEEYKVFVPALNTVVDVKDQREFPMLSHNTANLALSYDRPLGEVGDLQIRLSWSYIDDMAMFAENSDSTYIDAYSLVSGRVAIGNISMGADGALEVALWGKNLTDEEYFNSGIDFGAFGFTVNQFGEPRTYGIELSYEF